MKLNIFQHQIERDTLEFDLEVGTLEKIGLAHV